MLFLHKITKISFTLGLNLCVFASGSGSNLLAIIEAGKSGYISSQVVLVVSNNSASGALETAKKYNIPAYHLSQKLFSTEFEFESRVLDLLNEYKADLILLAGYMKKLSSAVVKQYSGRILNIHPALLPKYGGKGMYGIHVHEAVISANEKVTGATVHFVNEVYDSGEIILQKHLKVNPDDNALSLQKRVLETEHKLYPEAIKMFEEDRVGGKSSKVAKK